MALVDLYTQDLSSVAVSVFCGACIGLEREYKSKFAGFRTIILICLGSTLFTIVSLHITNGSQDRIASNIVTGIGFIGAGVVFKDKIWVKGLTTAAVIWVSSAIGMICGTGNYLFAVILTGIVVVILSLFNWLEHFIDAAHQRKQLNITFRSNDLQALRRLEEYIRVEKLNSSRLQIQRYDEELVVMLLISGSRNRIHDLCEYLVGLPEIRAFEAV